MGLHTGELENGAGRRIGMAVATVFAVVFATLVATTPAQADVSPPAPDPATVTADALPTVQIDGIVWDQEVVGNVVYAAGSFSSARPAGAAAGTNETPRSNLLAYDITTGELIESFAPTINAQVRSVAASPDGTKLYIVGDFTTVNGVTRNRVAAFDLPSGTLSSFNPSSNGTTIGVDATDTTVYITGTFGRVGGQDRFGAAAVTVDGTLLPWAPVLGLRLGRVVLASPDGTKVVLGGDFPTLNGSTNPGYGLGMVDAVNGALIVPFQTNSIVRNAGTSAAILSLKSDGESFYGTGYSYARGGNFEGTFRSSWATGQLTWVNDCHGDEYDVQPMGDVIYAVGHSHYCGSLEGGFPESNPWTNYRAIALTKDVARITPMGLNHGYAEFGGNPAPKLLHWIPTINVGTVSGAAQGAWTINGNSEYLVLGGEFTRVNYTAQQGLVRYAVAAKAPNAQGPLLWNTDWPATAQVVGGAIRVAWPLNWDRDSEFLKYEVLRDNIVVKTFENVRSKPVDWALPGMAYMDAAVVSGTSYTYRIRATDSQGHSIVGGIVTATAAGSIVSSPYRDVVLADNPADYWPLDESTGAAYDWNGPLDLTVRSGVTRGQSGAILGESRTAALFRGGTNSFATTTRSVASPQSFAIEAWFKTTSTSGGKIVGFGDKTSGDSNTYDRHVYMLTNGQLAFGVSSGGNQVVQSSSAYNDGQWHHVVANLGAGGMTMYVDGAKVGERADITSASAYNGYWRIGGDSTWSGSTRFNGTIDEVAVYRAPLVKAQVAAHYLASGRAFVGATPPADLYGASVYTLDPALFWRLGETTGTTAVDASGNARPGTYLGSINKNAAGALLGVADTAVIPAGGQIVSKTSMVNPRIYSLEAWFKTGSTAGGKIIGFGNSSSASNSSAPDRHVYMTNTGKLAFGVWNGSQVVLQSDAAYNDDTWHHVVATQGSEGMRLYVDGALLKSNTQMNSRNITGYWHVGGDVSWGPGGNAFAGSIDEVAVYQKVISATDVAMHHSLGATGLPVNLLPTASLTSVMSKSLLTVDASASADTDGTIAEYTWNWGDGSADGSGATATHTYEAAGSYTVTLTVTDNQGGTATKTAVVTAVANQAPVASFTTVTTDLAVAVDATASSDADGTITSYSWNWGDGSADSAGATATHTYAAAGEFTVTLTVTDSDGAITQQTAAVTVAPPVGAAVYARDGFGRTTATGLGSADFGGAWALSNTASNYRVDGTSAVFIQTGGGAQRYAYLPSISSTDTAVETDVVLNQNPVGGSAFATLHLRRVGALDYRARVVIASNGALTVQLQQTTVILSNVVTSLNVDPGEKLRVRAEAFGTSPTTVRVKMWKAGTSEPADWTASATDATAALQAAGDVGLGVYLGGGVTNTPFQTTFDNFWAGSTTGVVLPPENVAPTAAFVATPTNLTVDVDAATSTDSDGTIASYAWDFGDGNTGTGVAASHSYAAAGTYTVSLVITDDSGAESTVSQSVTVAVPDGANAAPVAAFTVTAADLVASVDASTSTDSDGTIVSYAWDFGDGTAGSNVTEVHTYASVGTYTISLTVTDDLGATGTTTNEVIVTAPTGPVEPVVFAKDEFDRADGVLAAALLGGNWTQTAGTANVAVDSGRARLTTAAGSQTRTASLTGATSDSTDLTFSFSTSAAVVGPRMYLSALGRVVGSDDYRARWLIAPNGSVQAQLSRGGTVMTWAELGAGFTVTPESVYRVRLQVFGTGTTTIRSKIWADGQAEPAAWQLSTTDTTAALQAAGYTGISTYSGGGFGPVPYSVFVDDYQAIEVTP